jgi:hypothetical protein
MINEVLRLFKYENEDKDTEYRLEYLLPALPVLPGMKPENILWHIAGRWDYKTVCEARTKAKEIWHKDYPNAAFQDATYTSYEIYEIEDQGDMITYYCKDENGNKFSVFIDYDETISIGPYCRK